MKIFDLNFLNPEYFLILLCIPIFIFIYFLNNKKKYIFGAYNDLKIFFKKNSFFFYFKLFLIIIIFFLFSIIFANPNLENILEKEKKNGIDIILVFDISESMNAVDLKPTRLELAKKLLLNFLEKQKTNRVGLVVFAGQPFVGIPLTFDYNVIKENIKNITSKIINQQELGGTNIGDSILMAKNSFKNDNENREKIIILFTDGESNTGINPIIASNYIKDLNIKIYTIGIGGKEKTYMLQKVGPFSNKYEIPPLNDKSLQEISKITNGKFFRAIDNKSFEKIFEEIEKLEKGDLEIKTQKSFKDFYDIFVYLLSFFIFVLLVLIILRK